ncbi:hypothetical protein [Streptomyces sp. NBC_00358]|uniref:hypothetical protein n=1 Tax=Streptomyces sp. NBC_00358 TaxID=2975725 RepID=UPI002E268435
MSGSTDSETHARTTLDRETRDHGDQPRDDQGQETRDPGDRAREGQDREDLDRDARDPEDKGDKDQDDDGPYPEARRARWTAVGTGALLTVAGLAASAMRSTGSEAALIPLSYASGAALCAGASVLGARGRTRRALWLMIVGVMVMAVGDQFD